MAAQSQRRHRRVSDGGESEADADEEVQLEGWMQCTDADDGRTATLLSHFRLSSFIPSSLLPSALLSLSLPIPISSGQTVSEVSPIKCAVRECVVITALSQELEW